jgi:excisionase family DNA binding protein
LTQSDKSLPVRADHSHASTPRLISVREVARLLGCSQRHVYRMVDLGRMPQPVKLGGLNRWSIETIEDWIRAGCPAVRKLGRG